MKTLITNYTFDASAQTIEFDDFVSILLERVLLITNVTDNIIIYNFAQSGKGGTVATNILTLDFDTTAMSDTDDLQIFYDDDTETQAISGTVTVNEPVSIDDNGSSITVDGTVAVTGVSTAANQTTIIGHVDGIETLLTGIDADTATLAGAVSGTEVQVDVVTSALPTGAATEAKQDTGNTSLSNINTKLATAKTADFDSGAGTDTVQMLGIALPASGGAVAGGTTTNPIQIADAGGNISIDDGGNTITVDGTVAVTGVATAANQATIIGHLDGVEGILTTIDADTGNIATGIATIAGAVAGSEMQVDIVSSALPTGASTAANQATIIGHLDGVETLLTTIAGDTTDIETAVELLDDTVATIATTPVIRVALFDDADTQVTSFGGGQEYTEDATPPATVVGKALVFEDSGGAWEFARHNAGFPVDFNTIRGNAISTAGGNGTQAVGGKGQVGDNLSTDSFPMSIGGSDYAGTPVKQIAKVDSSGNQYVAVTSSTLPTGAATSAKQDTIIGHLDGVETSLTAIEADTSRLDNSSSPATMYPYFWNGTAFEGVTGYTGVGMSVVVNSALPAGTNNIGDVDVLSVVPGTGATNLGKAIDTAAGSTDTGIAPLAVRDDALATLTPVDGDYVPLRTDASGNLWVSLGTKLNATDDAVDLGGSALTALQLIDNNIVVDDAAFTPATTSVGMAGFEYDDTSPDTVNEGDAGAARMSANRNQYVQIRDNAGNERGLNIDASGQLAVTLAASQTLATVTTVGTVTNITNQGHLADDAAFTPGTTRVMMAGFEFDDTTPDSVNEGDGGAARMSANRNIYTTLRDSAGNERGLNIDANGEIGIGAIRTSVTPGTSAAHLGKAEDAAHASGDTGVMALAVRNDGLATTFGGDQDYSPVAVNNKGALFTQHAITSIGHGVTTVTTAGTDVVLASSTACKKIVIQSQTDNTGVIAVGATGVDATVATGTGILLYPGDIFELEIDNLADVFIDSTVNGEGVRYTYFS